MPVRPGRSAATRNGIWSEDEHDRFLAAIRRFPQGPWSAIAEVVGSRSVRQVQTHTQKYYEKIMRRMRGLRKDRKTWARLEHRIDDDILEFCDLMSRSARAPEATGGPLAALSVVAASPGGPAIKQEPASPDGGPFRLEDWDLAAYGLAPTAVAADADMDLPSLEESLDFLIAAMEA